MNTNNTAPLTAEVVAEMVARLRIRGQHLRSTWDDGDMEFAAADMITTLTTQLAERDAEVARMTALNVELCENYNSQLVKLAHQDVELTAATRRIAALTEALQSLMDLNDNYAPFGGELYRDRVDRTWDKARAALTTDKEPT